MGFSDVGFSSCTAPTYYPMSEYFGQRAEVWGLMPKNVLMGEHHGRWVAEILGFGSKCPDVTSVVWVSQALLDCKGDHRSVVHSLIGLLCSGHWLQLVRCAYLKSSV